MEARILDVRGSQASLSSGAGIARAEVVVAQEWDRALALFDDVNYEHSSIFTSRVWGARNTVCVLVRDGGELLGGMCYGLVRVPMIGAVGIVRFGPSWRPRGIAATPERFRRVVEALCRHAADAGIALTFIPRAHTLYTAMEAEELTRLGFARRERVNGDHHIVDASLSADEQMASFTAKCRSNVRKAQETRVTISELTDYSVFQSLYARMTERKQVHLLRPVDVVPALSAGLPEELRPRGLVASIDGKPIAARIYGILGDTAYSLYSATTSEALPLRAGYKLHWEILGRIRGRVRWYDLGSASSDQGMHWLKEGFVGKRGKIVMIPGEYDFAPGARARLALRSVYAVRELRRAYLRILRVGLQILARIKPSPSAPAG